MADLTIDEKIARLTAALADLASLATPSQPVDHDFAAAPETPYELYVTYSDGREEMLDKVAEFHLVDTRTNEWPVGLASPVEDADPVIGYWTRDGDFRKHDDRRQSRRPGW